LGVNSLIDRMAAFLIDNSALKRSVPLLPILSPVRFWAPHTCPDFSLSYQFCVLLQAAAHRAMNVTAAAAISSVTCPQRFPTVSYLFVFIACCCIPQALRPWGDSWALNASARGTSSKMRALCFLESASFLCPTLLSRPVRHQAFLAHGDGQEIDF
jgi:hypothetical protein